MSPPNTINSLCRDLSDMGLKFGSTVMVHSSLGKVGWTVGGPVSVIRALLEVLGPEGTLVMPAESPGVSDPSSWNDERVRADWHETIREHLPVFDPLTTPTTMGAIPEAFRTYPGTLRSNHPMVSVCANGSLADEITRDHSMIIGAESETGSRNHKGHFSNHCLMFLFGIYKIDCLHK
jgi:aminoglycoside 3-N-acetyltransferase